PGAKSLALVREGPVMAMIGNKGYLRHSLKNRLETGSFGQQVTDPYFDTLEKRLLAADQLVFKLLKENRWAE
ncbi:MAG: hypothetical protein HN366_27930, partial [Deltaproteobacteria bacterium]|nr:hypothetical protein [Deltaproteobacteria bacterium]